MLICFLPIAYFAACFVIGGRDAKRPDQRHLLHGRMYAAIYARRVRGRPAQVQPRLRAGARRGVGVHLDERVSC